MGVEYLHYLIPADPRFQANADQVRNAIRILGTHHAWGSSTAVFSNAEAGFTQATSVDAARDGYVRSQGDLEGEKIARLMGGSAYDDTPDDCRYLQEVTVVYGPGLKVHESSESHFVDTAKIRMIPTPSDGDPLPFQGLLANQQDPSHIRVSSENSALDRRFAGWWRFAICLNCGKDIPAWSDAMTMSNRALIDDLTRGLGVPFCEIGHYA